MIKHPPAISFHPLKAGRRLGQSARQKSGKGVSIPSRRVGDYVPTMIAAVTFGGFPSPQGGSETNTFPAPRLSSQLFPSPQGGSETELMTLTKCSPQRFPSPQGGSETFVWAKIFPSFQSFHPLKAGRRPTQSPPHIFELLGFHPLKAGRRPPSTQT